MIRQLAHVCLFTDDLDRMRRFYMDALGLSLAHTFVNPSSSETFGFYFGAGNQTFVEVFDRKGAQEMWGGDDPRIDRGTGFRHLCFEVKGMDAARSLLLSRGVHVSEPTPAGDEAVQAWTADPDGNPVEFMEYRPKSP